jgi:hypothetical protein
MLHCAIVALVGVLLASCSNDGEAPAKEREAEAGEAGSSGSGGPSGGSGTVGGNAGLGGSVGATGGSGGNAGRGGDAAMGGSGSGGDEATGGGGRGGEAAMGGSGGDAATGGRGGVAGGGGTGGAGTGGSAGTGGGNPNPYGRCTVDGDCPLPGSNCHETYGCEPPCERVPEPELRCPAAPPGGEAMPLCAGAYCRLDCSFDVTCPGGMTCDNTWFCAADG